MRVLSKYDVFESDSNGELPDNFLDLFEDELMSSDRVLILLTALGVKPACDIEGFFNSQESFEHFVSIMNETGLNCIVGYNPCRTSAESLANLAEDSDNPLIDEYEVKVRIFLKRENYNSLYFRLMNFFKKFYRSKYHRMYGEFLGFNEKDIDAFILDQKNDLTFGAESKKAVRPRELAEEYGSDLSEEELNAFNALHFGLLENSKERFHEGVDEMKRRMKILKQSSFDADKVVEERTLQ